MFNRAYVYMALAAFFAQTVESFWVASNRKVLIGIVAFFGGAIGLAIHEVTARNARGLPGMSRAAPWKTPGQQSQPVLDGPPDDLSTHAS